MYCKYQVSCQRVATVFARCVKQAETGPKLIPEQSSLSFLGSKLSCLSCLTCVSSQLMILSAYQTLTRTELVLAEDAPESERLCWLLLVGFPPLSTNFF